jgi:hypothetical protein
MNWKEFFQSYRIIQIKGDSDLLYQVGYTVSGKAISAEQFNALAESVNLNLMLNAQDGLIDLCCGNGIITYELSKVVNKTIGIDASQPYIENAIRYKELPNIRYIVHDVTELEKLKRLADFSQYNKVLLYYALSYLSPADLDKILTFFDNVKSIERILIGSVLDSDRKWKFFNTPKRMLVYFYKCKVLRNDFGLGRWWTKDEITTLAKKHGFVCAFIEQDPVLHTAHYRFDVLMTRTN